MQARPFQASVDAVVARVGSVPVLVVATLVMMLPGFFTLPPMDRDEPRFAQASKQMLETSDFVAIRFGDEARNKKPVGIHWLQAAAVGLGEGLGVPDARRQIWLYRIPSLLGAVGAVLLTYWAALAVVSRPYAVLAGLFLAATPLLGVEARLATTDAVLAASVAAAMGALARAYLAGTQLAGTQLAGTEPARAEPARNRHGPGPLGTAVVFWGAIGVGLLIKGPITPLVVGLSALALSIGERSGRWLLALRPLPGAALCLLMVLPWFVLILVQTRGAFLADAVGHDLLGKVAGGQEGHGAPPGFYFLTFWLTGWPLAPFVALAAPSAWRHRREPAVRFLAAWIVPTWLVFEIFHTKLVHYALPVFPGLAILVAWALDGMARQFGAPDAKARQSRALGPMARQSRALDPMARQSRALDPMARQSRAPASLAGWALFGLLALVPAVILVLVAGGQGRLWALGGPALGLAALAVLAALALAWAARACFARGDLREAGLAAVLAAVPVYGLVYGFLLTPGVSAALDVSPRLAGAARAALGPACADPLYATVGDREPSLMFATNGRLLMTDADGAARFVREGGCRVAFVERREEAAFRAALGQDPPVREVTRVGGIAINGGAPLDIGVFIRS